MFEKAYARVMENVAKSPPFKQKIFHTCLRIGLRYSRYLQAGKPIPLVDRVLYDDLPYLGSDRRKRLE
jgi:long-subunit acyl-CoA synthetase (AMP-forming)